MKRLLLLTLVALSSSAWANKTVFLDYDYATCPLGTESMGGAWFSGTCNDNDTEHRSHWVSAATFHCINKTDVEYSHCGVWCCSYAFYTTSDSRQMNDTCTSWIYPGVDGTNQPGDFAYYHD
jgi:hypothetical protein